MLFSCLVAFEVDPAIAEWVRSDGKTKNAVAPTTRIAMAARATMARRVPLDSPSGADVFTR
jgi:hypothetical protein